MRRITLTITADVDSRIVEVKADGYPLDDPLLSHFLLGEAARVLNRRLDKSDDAVESDIEKGVAPPVPSPASRIVTLS